MAETKNEITIDSIISKFIPIVGAIFLSIGFAYLLYTSIWVHLETPVRLGLGFFLSLAIVGGGFSVPARLRYLADVVIGMGVLLLYGTLIYGSRTSDAALATIPEVASILTSAIFTVALAYLAQLRKSQAILILSLIGAYITPFVIGQNGVWAQNVSFNAYLLYFLFVNISVFFVGRTLSVRHIIPVNAVGLLLSVPFLYYFSSSTGSSEVSFFTGSVLSSILFAGIAVAVTGSIAFSATEFNEEDEFLLISGYVLPIFWLLFNFSLLKGSMSVQLAAYTQGAVYTGMAIAYFFFWQYLQGQSKARYQHIALHAGGVFSVILALRAFIVDITPYTSLIFPYIGLLFGGYYLLKPRGERFLTYWFMSALGAIIVLYSVYFDDYALIKHHGVVAAIGLLPAMLGYFLASQMKQEGPLSHMRIYSSVAGVIGGFLLLTDLLHGLDAGFCIFMLPSLMALLWIRFSGKISEAQGGILRASLFWMAIGFIPVFLSLVGSIYPAPRYTHLWMNGGILSDWIFVKGLFAAGIFFVGLSISRQIQAATKEDRPSFLLVIFGYTTLLLTMNYAILAGMNDAGVELSHGGPRAVATTLWWIGIAIWMLVVGIRKGAAYRSEKLLGLLLLALTIGKILLYDLVEMDMEKKIIVLMTVGGALMMFSYFVHEKGWLKSEVK